MSAEFLPGFSDENNISLLGSGGIEASSGNPIKGSGEDNIDPGDLDKSLREQLTAAYAGSLITIDQINTNLRRTKRINVPGQAKLEEEFVDWLYQPRQDWLDQPRYDYIVQNFKKYPDLKWNLSAKPNVTITETQLLGGAIKFGNSQPMPTEISHDNIIGQYKPEEISGTNPKNGRAFMFELIGSALISVNVDLPKLRSMRDGKNPYAGSASPLGSLNWLNTLSARGLELVGPNVDKATYLPSLGLDPKYSRDGWRVPSLHIRESGALVIGSSMVFDANQSVRASFPLVIRPMIR